MSVKENIYQFLNKLTASHGDQYTKFQKSLVELQPIAFLITASLVIATFLNTKSLEQQYALTASIMFFLAYLGLLGYKFLKDFVYFYWAILLIAGGFALLYYSFSDVILLILHAGSPHVNVLMSAIIFSGVYVLALSHFLKYRTTSNILYKINKFLLSSALILKIVFYLPNIYYYSNRWFYLFGISLPPLFALISFAISISNLKE